MRNIDNILERTNKFYKLAQNQDEVDFATKQISVILNGFKNKAIFEKIKGAVADVVRKRTNGQGDPKLFSSLISPLNYLASIDPNFQNLNNIKSKIKSLYDVVAESETNQDLLNRLSHSLQLLIELPEPGVTPEVKQQPNNSQAQKQCVTSKLNEIDKYIAEAHSETDIGNPFVSDEKKQEAVRNIGPILNSLSQIKDPAAKWMIQLKLEQNLSKLNQLGLGAAVNKVKSQYTKKV